MSVQRFAVCTFDRVFDTAPKQETLTLPQLVRGLLRFDLKPDLQRNVERTWSKIDAAWQTWQEGGYRPGKQFAAIKTAADAAKRDGQDVDEAARTALERLKTDAAGSPKRDLRLWAPALYRPNSKRGSENVIHLSCLVLDYDKGLPFEEAQARWVTWFHVAHSTWSHTADKPKFRICLPLAGPVAPQHWRDLWNWAHGITGDWIDHAMKGVGVTFALPAAPSVEAEKIGALNDDAPLLDPVALGVVPGFAPPPPVIADIDRPISHFNGGVPMHSYQEMAPPEPLEEPPDTLDISGDDWELPGPGAEGADEDWDERSDEWETLFDELP